MTGIFGPWDSALDSCKNGHTIEYKPKMMLLAAASASQIVVITKFLNAGGGKFYLCIRIDFYLFCFGHPIVLPKLQGSY
jgi:hypothetical protein